MSNLSQPRPQTVMEGAPPDFHYVAVLRTCASGHFKLFLNGCEACDRRCDKYTCGAAGADSDDRQLLAEVFHVRTLITYRLIEHPRSLIHHAHPTPNKYPTVGAPCQGGQRGHALPVGQDARGARGRGHARRLVVRVSLCVPVVCGYLFTLKSTTTHPPTHSPRTEHERSRASPSGEMDKTPSLKLVNKMPEWNEGMRGGIALGSKLDQPRF